MKHILTILLFLAISQLQAQNIYNEIPQVAFDNAGNCYNYTFWDDNYIFKTTSTIESTATVDPVTNISYISEQPILLNPDFEVPLGSTFVEKLVGVHRLCYSDVFME